MNVEMLLLCGSHIFAASQEIIFFERTSHGNISIQAITC